MIPVKIPALLFLIAFPDAIQSEGEFNFACPDVLHDRTRQSLIS